MPCLCWTSSNRLMSSPNWPSNTWSLETPSSGVAWDGCQPTRLAAKTKPGFSPMVIRFSNIALSRTDCRIGVSAGRTLCHALGMKRTSANDVCSLLWTVSSKYWRNRSRETISGITSILRMPVTSPRS